MTLKKIKLLKIMRILLLSCFVYLSTNQTAINSNEKFSYSVVSWIIFFNGLIISSIIPEKNRLGNTFLDVKFKWLEQVLEFGSMFLLAWVLCQF